jgi:hypothetical protein
MGKPAEARRPRGVIRWWRLIRHTDTMPQPSRGGNDRVGRDGVLGQEAGC